jgi:predicted anti-sigma-YlaC factor YlaD
MKTWIMKLLARTPPGTMDCHQVGELLQQYLDGHTDEDRSHKIRMHLDECRRCGMEAHTYERIKSTLSTHRSAVPAESVTRLREFGERLARGDIPS